MSPSTTAEYAYISLWNMNGGPVPTDAINTVTQAIEVAVKEAEQKNGTRLLYSVVTNDPVEV